MRPSLTTRAFAPLLLAAVAATAVSAGAGGSEPAQPPPTGHEHHATTKAEPAKGAPVKGQHMTITGEVMDPACFLEAGVKSIGPGHYQCAIDCARSGQTLAIYDREKDRIYFIAGELPGKNPNDPLMAYIHKKVDVTGAVYHRAGVYGIVINRVALHKDKGAAAKASAEKGSAAKP